MKELLKKLYMLPAMVWNILTLHLHRSSVGKNVVINGRLRLFGKGNLTLEDDVRINSMYRMNPIGGGNVFSSIYIKSQGEVVIGRGTGISNVAIYAVEKVFIGKNCKIGGGVCIYDTDFHSLDYLERHLDVDPGVKSKPIFIGDDVFAGAQSIILKGVSIGDRSIVAAGSVVTKTIPDDEIWGGNPAHFIRKINND